MSKTLGYITSRYVITHWMGWVVPTNVIPYAWHVTSNTPLLWGYFVSLWILSFFCLQNEKEINLDIKKYRYFIIDYVISSIKYTKNNTFYFSHENCIELTNILNIKWHMRYEIEIVIIQFT